MASASALENAKRTGRKVEVPDGRVGKVNAVGNLFTYVALPSDDPQVICYLTEFPNADLHILPPDEALPVEHTRGRAKLFKTS